ncbi:MAG: 16S rRNA (cytosine(1402)-N(4))-methyltransferase RsmH [Patescibacteria group bacterium]|jgi:16S rRNA (cytosine1402-N4)-methyltransferase
MLFQHTPVLLKEVLDYLNVQPGDIAIDGTIGGAGHSREILKKIKPNGFLLGLDLDKAAIKASQERLSLVSNQFKLINDSFAKIEFYGKQLEFLSKVSAILLDLGVSSYEIRDAGRGFSFQKPDELLDLRMNEDGPLTAADILNTYREEEICSLLKEYGEEPLAKKISRRVCLYRKTKKIEKVSDLLKIVAEAYQGQRKPKKIHMATRTWQALRIAVNDELYNLQQFLPSALRLLKPGGRLAIISFHSLEDRIVKNFFRQESKDCLCSPDVPMCVCHHKKQIKLLTKKPVTPSPKEIEDNPPSRSAKLRVIAKI